MRPELLEFIDGRDSYEVRGMRILLEYFFANEKFREIGSGLRGISVFGSARVPDGDNVYETSRKVGKLLYDSGYAVITGASGGVMEAANRGVSDAILEKIMMEDDLSEDEAKKSAEYAQRLARYSIGLKITLPFEKEVNDYLGTWASFHYFAVRKFYFAMLSEGFIRCDGGWGTRDEFWEVATLVQTGKTPVMPIVALLQDPSHLQSDLEGSIKNGFISEVDRNLIDFAETAEQAVDIINQFYSYLRKLRYSRTKDDFTMYLRMELPMAHKISMENYMKQNPGVFGGIEFYEDRVELLDYTYKSFGHLRKMVNALNGVEFF